MGAQRHEAESSKRRASFLAGVLVALCASCPLDLPRGVSCGDGWWDSDFEECDPSDPAHSYLDACRELGFAVDASCDPQTCEIVADLAHCNVCGDGVRAEGEACDGFDIPNGTSCPGVLPGSVGCTDACTLDYTGCPASCGNGVLDLGEECDYMLDCESDGDCPAASPVCHPELRECMSGDDDGLADVACARYPVTAWNHGKTEASYTAGAVGRCTNNCVFDREACSFCGDGELDGPYHDLGWPNIEYDQPAEKCDGQADIALLSASCFGHCGITPTTGLLLRCAYTGCTDDCKNIEFGGFQGVDCCVIGGVPCPPDALGLDCCYWIDHDSSYGQCVQGTVTPECPGFAQPLPGGP